MSVYEKKQHMNPCVDTEGYFYISPQREMDILESEGISSSSQAALNVQYSGGFCCAKNIDARGNISCYAVNEGPDSVFKFNVSTERTQIQTDTNYSNELNIVMRQ